MSRRPSNPEIYIPSKSWWFGCEFEKLQDKRRARFYNSGTEQPSLSPVWLKHRKLSQKNSVQAELVIAKRLERL